jgi:hypothetical protein
MLMASPVWEVKHEKTHHHSSFFVNRAGLGAGTERSAVCQL